MALAIRPIKLGMAVGPSFVALATFFCLLSTGTLRVGAALGRHICYRVDIQQAAYASF